MQNIPNAAPNGVTEWNTTDKSEPGPLEAARRLLTYCNAAPHSLPSSWPHSRIRSRIRVISLAAPITGFYSLTVR